MILIHEDISYGRNEDYYRGFQTLPKFKSHHPQVNCVVVIVFQLKLRMSRSLSGYPQLGYNSAYARNVRNYTLIAWLSGRPNIVCNLNGKAAAKDKGHIF